MKKISRDWIKGFFGGETDFYRTAFGWIHPTIRNNEEEAGSIVRLLRIEPGAHILDWCGGYGRISVPLARSGFKITILDNCREYLEEVERISQAEGLSMHMVLSDFRETPPSIQADYAINLWTAGIGYFGRDNDIAALKSLYGALKPGAKFLIDTVNLFYIVGNFERTTTRINPDGSQRQLEKRTFDSWTNINHVEVTMQQKGAKRMKRKHGVRMYSPAELADMLREVGLMPTELYGDFNGSPFDFSSKRIIMISERGTHA